MEQIEIVAIACLVVFGLILSMLNPDRFASILQNPRIQRDIAIGMLVNASFLTQNNETVITGILVGIISIYAIMDAEYKKERR